MLIRDRRAWIAAACLLLQALLAVAIVPPWQFPDEPTHFEGVRAIAISTPLDLSITADLAIEQEILASMDAHDWWRLSWGARPDPLPVKFGDTPMLQAGGAGGVNSAPPLYYVSGGLLLRALGITSFDAQYRTMRLVSVGAGVVAVLLVAGALGVAGLPPAAAGAVLSLMVLHPQFVLIITAVNPDSIAAMLGAATLLGLVLFGRSAADRRRALVLMGLAGALGVLTKRTAAPLAAVFLAALVAHVLTRVTRPRDRAIAAVLALAAVGVAGGAAWVVAPQVMVRALLGPVGVLSAITGSTLAAAWSPAFLGLFFSTLYDSFWLRAGWMTYAASEAWIVAMRVVGVGALAGLLFAATVAARRPPHWPAIRTSLFITGTVLAVVLVGYFLRGELAQGRYLIAAEGALMLLVWTGWRSVIPRAVPDHVVAVLFAALAVSFNLASWWRLLLAYHTRGL